MLFTIAGVVCYAMHMLILSEPGGGSCCKGDVWCMSIPGLRKMVDKLAKVDGVCWCMHVLRREEDDDVRKAPRLKLRTKESEDGLRRQVQKSLKKLDLKNEDALDLAKREAESCFSYQRCDVNLAPS